MCVWGGRGFRGDGSGGRDFSSVFPAQAPFPGLKAEHLFSLQGERGELGWKHLLSSPSSCGVLGSRSGASGNACGTAGRRHSRSFWNTRPRAPSQGNLFSRNLTGPLRGAERVGGGGGLATPSQVPQVDFEREMSVKKAGLLSQKKKKKGEGVSYCKSPENGFQGASWCTLTGKQPPPRELDLEGGGALGR